MRTRSLLTATAAVLALAGCASTATTPVATKPMGKEPAPAASTPAAASSPASSPVAVDGLPPKPDEATAAAYIAALTAIDADIVHGKPDKAIDRGRNQCFSMRDTKDRAKLVDLTNKRFTSPTHPDGHGTAKAEKILDIVHKHLCPAA